MSEQPQEKQKALLRTRCSQGRLIITETEITVQLGRKSKTMLRTSLVNVERKILLPSVLGMGGGANLTFYDQDGEQLHASLVPPKAAKAVQSLLESSLPPKEQLPSPPSPSPSTPAQPEQRIKTYKMGFGDATKKFQKDADKLVQEGWRVQNVTTTGLTLFGQAESLTVVYTR